jgi:hypothetical protein
MQDLNNPDPEGQEGGAPPSPAEATAAQPAVPEEPATEGTSSAESQSAPDPQPTGGTAVDDAVGASDEPAEPVAAAPTVSEVEETPLAAEDARAAEPVASAVAVAEPVATTARQGSGVWTEEQAAAFRARLSEGTAKVVDTAAGAVIDAINTVAELVRSRAANRRGGTRD